MMTNNCDTKDTKCTMRLGNGTKKQQVEHRRKQQGVRQTTMQKKKNNRTTAKKKTQEHVGTLLPWEPERKRKP